MPVYIDKQAFLDCMKRTNRYFSVKFDIESFPAADVAPVRHGHWNAGYFHDRVCSCCLHPDNDINDYAHSYCPNCGAKMDESEDKNEIS